ncbi:hypothetical protein T265_11213 [Opisthorchis viverrini]|uniref:Uncharacterized protein n=1 Tax=Opisthorchis viverrini TaxID=6198 RepID=A0A074Z3V4_OPIVI|nr:hypothetical protein T265_11213 [Opisthorchis viverrini]KER20177.1 hypothetical protein T265_11213 [Opisthorchis viverrini]
MSGVQTTGRPVICTTHERNASPVLPYPLWYGLTRIIAPRQMDNYSNYSDVTKNVQLSQQLDVLHQAASCFSHCDIRDIAIHVYLCNVAENPSTANDRFRFFGAHQLGAVPGSPRDDAESLGEISDRIRLLKIRTRGIFESGEFVGNKCWKSTLLHEIYETCDGRSTKLPDCDARGYTWNSVQNQPVWEGSDRNYSQGQLGGSLLSRNHTGSTNLACRDDRLPSSIRLNSCSSQNDGLSDLQRLQNKRAFGADPVNYPNAPDNTYKHIGVLPGQNCENFSCLQTPPPQYSELGLPDAQYLNPNVPLVHGSNYPSAPSGLGYTVHDLEQCSSELFGENMSSGISSNCIAVPFDDSYSSCSLDSLLAIPQSELNDTLQNEKLLCPSESKRKTSLRTRRSEQSLGLLYDPSTMSSKHFWEAHKQYTTAPRDRLQTDFFELIRRSSRSHGDRIQPKRRAAFSKLAGLANALLFRQRARIWEIPEWRDHNENNLLEVAVHERNADAVALLLQEGFFGLDASSCEPPLLVQIALETAGSVVDINWDNITEATQVTNAKRADSGGNVNKSSCEQEILLHFLHHLKELRGRPKHFQLLNGISGSDATKNRPIVHQLLDMHSFENDLSWSMHQLTKAGADLFSKVQNSDGQYVDCFQRAAYREDANQLLTLLLHGTLYSVKVEKCVWSSEKFFQGRYSLAQLRRALSSGHLRLDNRHRMACLDLINTIMEIEESEAVDPSFLGIHSTAC